MGLPMAKRLVSGGFDVVGYSRSTTNSWALGNQGSEAATSIEEAVVGAAFIATMLPSSDAVWSVLAGANGVFAHAGAGSLVIDFSTTAPDVSIRLAEEGGRRGLEVLDAPVSGGVSGAGDGTLSVMVGGAVEAFVAARPVLETVGSNVVRVGPAGCGQIAKAANQLIVAGTIGLVAEAVVLLEAYGLDLHETLGVVGTGQARSAVLERKGSKMIDRDFTPQFRLELLAKDLSIVLAVARRAGLVLPIGELIGRLFAAADSRGDSELDCSAVLKLILDNSRAG